MLKAVKSWRASSSGPAKLFEGVWPNRLRINFEEILLRTSGNFKEVLESSIIIINYSTNIIDAYYNYIINFFFLLALQPPLGVVFYSPLVGFSLLACEVS